MSYIKLTIKQLNLSCVILHLALTSIGASQEKQVYDAPI